MVEPLYAWPRGPEEDKQVAVIAQILRDSFNQSETKIKDEKALESAARHILHSNRVSVDVKL